MEVPTHFELSGTGTLMKITRSKGLRDAFVFSTSPGFDAVRMVFSEHSVPTNSIEYEFITPFSDHREVMFPRRQIEFHANNDHLGRWTDLKIVLDGGVYFTRRLMRPEPKPKKDPKRARRRKVRFFLKRVFGL